jgi:hypothetical protein
VQLKQGFLQKIFLFRALTSFVQSPFAPDLLSPCTTLVEPLMLEWRQPLTAACWPREYLRLDSRGPVLSACHTRLAAVYGGGKATDAGIATSLYLALELTPLEVLLADKMPVGVVREAAPVGSLFSRLEGLVGLNLFCSSHVSTLNSLFSQR